jgi:hypothetical protein
LPRRDPGEDAYMFLRDVCASVIASGRLRPEFRDPDELSQMAWSALHGLLALQIVMQDKDWIQWRDAEKTTSRIGDALVAGLLAKPGP